MAVKHLARALVLAVITSIAAPAVFAGDQSKTAPKPLEDNENPALIGKRNINKRQIDFYSLEKEAALGAKLAADVGQQAKFVDDPIIVEYVNRLGQNLVLHSDAKVPFQIKVIDSDDVNAFALPGGYFFVNKGLLLAADNEAELAGVMAHEIAHVAARHGVENASKGTLLNYATLPLILLGGGVGYAVRTAASILVPVGFLKFSRNAEYEADTLGAQYMWAAGYDPRALGDFFEKLQGKEKKKPGTLARLFSTHPISGDRLVRVNALVARFPGREEYLVTTSEFDRVKSHLLQITNAPAATGAPRDTGPQRPTLKRRPTNDPTQAPDPMDPTAQPADPNAPPPPPAPDRPTLKRRDADAPPPVAPPNP
ncbi:MAG: M48 family metalloprotease [Acidobacteria bacterium]|nr:M48 family metalloprotease [Acidobacteriota bacterium]